MSDTLAHEARLKRATKWINDLWEAGETAMMELDTEYLLPVLVQYEEFLMAVEAKRMTE
jgi:hypothetical protein